MIAALFVATGGCYFGLAGVDPWDEARDARLYAGPWPVVAHPPCERWGRFAGARRGRDGGCFEAALAAVRRWGGVLEHPADSRAWAAFKLIAPPRSGGWVVADDCGGWTCCVEQGRYGHRAKKATWLYSVGCPLPSLAWGKDAARRFSPSWMARLAAPGATEEDRRRAVKTGVLQSLSKKQRAATPAAFRELLLSMARGVSSNRGAA